MTIKELFDKAENGTLTWEQFQSAMTEANAKFVDLNEGKYVSKNKYDTDIANKTTEIETLNSTLKTRDGDLADLKSQLEAAGVDANKLSELNTKFTDLQTKYTNDTKAYKEQLRQQAYEFAVKEFANTKKFTSQAARRDFERAMIDKGLKMENDKILGADDFVTSYSNENADAFVVESPTPQDPQPPKPQFVNPTPGANPPQAEQNAFFNAFHFTGVRPMNQNNN